MSEIDDDHNKPQVFAVSRKAVKNDAPDDFESSRRGFLGMGAAAIGATIGGDALAAEKEFGNCRVTAKFLNMRNGPGTKYVIVDTLAKGTIVSVQARHKSEKGWLKVTGPKADGWVSRKYLDCGDADFDDAPIADVEPPVNYGRPGQPPPGEKGLTYQIGAKTYTLPCGSPIPSGATCTCNCVTTPGRTICTCDSVCTCQSVGAHYWYPN